MTRNRLAFCLSSHTRPPTRKLLLEEKQGRVDSLLVRALLAVVGPLEPARVAVVVGVRRLGAAQFGLALLDARVQAAACGAANVLAWQVAVLRLFRRVVDRLIRGEPHHRVHQVLGGFALGVDAVVALEPACSAVVAGPRRAIAVFVRRAQRFAVAPRAIRGRHLPVSNVVAGDVDVVGGVAPHRTASGGERADAVRRRGVPDCWLHWRGNGEQSATGGEQHGGSEGLHGRDARRREAVGTCTGDWKVSERERARA